MLTYHRTSHFVAICVHIQASIQKKFDGLDLLLRDCVFIFQDIVQRRETIVSSLEADVSSCIKKSLYCFGVGPKGRLVERCFRLRIRQIYLGSLGKEELYAGNTSRLCGHM